VEVAARVKGLAFVAALALSFTAHAFDLQGHRGARGLAPENTLPAFERALALGVTTLELDVAITSDGVLVIHHDSTLNPDLTRDSNGAFPRSPRPGDSFPHVGAAPDVRRRASQAGGPSTLKGIRRSSRSTARAFRGSPTCSTW
jgi:glycerophosphoryl diester phosphodiesterase